MGITDERHCILRLGAFNPPAVVAVHHSLWAIVTSAPGGIRTHMTLRCQIKSLERQPFRIGSINSQSGRGAVCPTLFVSSSGGSVRSVLLSFPKLRVPPPGLEPGPRTLREWNAATSTLGAYRLPVRPTPCFSSKLPCNVQNPKVAQHPLSCRNTLGNKVPRCH